jgi:hypothetical protein
MVWSNTNIVMKLLIKISVLLCLFSSTALSVLAQTAVPPPARAFQPLTIAQLDQLLGPIALYPDPLLAEILPASTAPAQIVLADRYVIGGGDTNQIGQQSWDASVQGLTRYTNVLKWMDDNLTWTTELGQAFLNQQPDVMQSIQRLRATASKLGNLQSSPQQQVITDGGNIEIVPADPQVIYVPVYQPARVYDDIADGSSFITYGAGWPMGAWLDYDFDWDNNSLFFWGNGYSRPANWWRESSRQRDMGHTTAWRPDNHPGAIAANRGDRGWSGNSLSHSMTPAVIQQELAHPVAQHNERSTSVARSTPGPVERATPINRTESRGAFIGVQSSRDTRAYSNRGQQSMRAFSRSAPVSRSTPSFGGGGRGGGGGGGRSGGGRR